PKQAKQSLADAGFANGNGFPKLTMLLRDPSVPVKTAAEAIQAMLKDNLGISVEIQAMDLKSYTDKLQKNDVQFSLLPFQYDYVHPSDMLNIWQTGRRNLWKNDDFDKVMKSANAVVNDDAKANGLYQQA